VDSTKTADRESPALAPPSAFASKSAGRHNRADPA